MRRRDFITLVGASAVAWPLALHAQQPMPVIGFLSAGSSVGRTNLIAAFRLGLSESGFSEGRNVRIEYRWANDQYEQLPALASDLVARGVSVIATPGSSPATLAAKSATSIIPIVFAVGTDPVKLGIVGSFNRPSGNLTGISFLSNTLPTKQFDLLRQLLPQALTIGLLVNPNFPNSDSQSSEMQGAADASGVKLVIAKAESESDFELAFSSLVEKGVGAVLIQTEPFFFSQRVKLSEYALRHALPTMCQSREFVIAGALVSYGGSLTDAWHLTGVYAGRILKGEKAADLPVQQSTKLELVINRKTAVQLKLTIPDRLLALADEVID